MTYFKLSWAVITMLPFVFSEAVFAQENTSIVRVESNGAEFTLRGLDISPSNTTIDNHETRVLDLCHSEDGEGNIKCVNVDWKQDILASAMQKFEPDQLFFESAIGDTWNRRAESFSRKHATEEFCEGEKGEPWDCMDRRFADIVNLIVNEVKETADSRVVRKLIEADLSQTEGVNGCGKFKVDTTDGSAEYVFEIGDVEKGDKSFATTVRFDKRGALVGHEITVLKRNPSTGFPEVLVVSKKDVGGTVRLIFKSDSYRAISFESRALKLDCSYYTAALMF